MQLGVWTWWGAWVKGNGFFAGGWLFFYRKRRRICGWGLGNKIKLLPVPIRWDEVFSVRLDVSCPLDCKFWSCSWGKNLKMFWFTCGLNYCGWMGFWMGGKDACGVCTEGRWLSAIPCLVMFANALNCWPVWFICVRLIPSLCFSRSKNVRFDQVDARSCCLKYNYLDKLLEYDFLNFRCSEHPLFQRRSGKGILEGHS